MTRTDRATALLTLLHASGIEAEAAYDLRDGMPGIAPGMLYAVDGQVFHLPFRARRGYIGSLTPKSPEARAYLNEAVPVEIPVICSPHPGHMCSYRARRKLRKK
jgi:hypothetical protein